MLFLVAQSPSTVTTCATVKLVRTMKGEASVITEVAAAITTMGVLAWVATGAVAMARGVRPKPASTFTLSPTNSSCARRRVTSGTPVSSLTMSWTFLPPTVSPFCAMYRRAAASSCLPVEAKGPVKGTIRPILKVLSCAMALGKRPAVRQTEAARPRN